MRLASQTLPRQDPKKIYEIHADRAGGLTVLEIATKHNLPATTVLGFLRSSVSTCALVSPYDFERRDLTPLAPLHVYWLGYIAATGRVLGQNNFTCNVSNNNGTCVSGSVSANNLDAPYVGIFSNGTQLFVADFFNSRVLVWNTFPTGNFQAADVVLGQNNFTCGAPNNDGTCGSGSPSANNLNLPNGVFQSGNRLIVSDEGNSRFLVYKGQ